ncbi:uncharacterized protein V6R79_007651 [Siganus canaliculatus]
MSTGLDGGRGRTQLFLSAHRCPEVDLLPLHKNQEQASSCSIAAAEEKLDFTCSRQSDVNYLEVSSEEEERSISDWSEEDLSLHFSPSVILHSEDEESDPDSSFECVDVRVETLVNGQEEEGLKMVPKRQIQLKKKTETENKDKPEQAQARPEDEPATGAVTEDLVRQSLRGRPELLHRQHSMPASLPPGDIHRGYRGLVAGASPGVPAAAVSRQRLQKSFSLDETKTKMASCFIKSILSKRMQVEKNSSKPSSCEKTPVLPEPAPPVDWQRGREGGGGITGVVRAPVHQVRDMRGFVKNAHSLSFSTTKTTPGHKSRAASFKVIGQEESPPPSYQQAVGVKGETKRSVTAPVSRQDDVTWRVMSADLPTNSADNSLLPQLGQSEPGSPPTSVCVQPRVSMVTRPAPSAQEQGSTLGLSSQQILHSYFYIPQSLAAPPTHLHQGRVSYIHGPLSYIQPPPTLQLLRRPEGEQTAGNTSEGLTHLKAAPRQSSRDQSIQESPPEITASAAASPGTVLTGSAPCPVMIDPTSGRCFYMDPAPQPQRKMLLDPETGQYVQVFLPAASSAPFTAPVINTTPTFLSVMQLQPTVAVPPFYIPSCLPLTIHSPPGNTHTTM